MFVKQIDLKTALELAARGNEVLVLVPGGDGDWANMQASTLRKELDGVLFFRQEPPMALPLMEADQLPPPTKKNKKVQLDTGKLIALRNAGWSMKKIAEELKVSEGTVFNYLKKLEAANEDKVHTE